MKKSILFLITFLIVTLLSGCNDTENVKELVTGKHWRLISFYDKNGNKILDRYPDANKIFIANPDGFYLSFADDNTFKGKGAKCSFSGTWRGDGKSNFFSMNITQMSGSETDLVAIDFISAVKETTVYKSGYNNLSLYYKNKNEYMSFFIKQAN